MLNVHPWRMADLKEPDVLRVDPAVPVEEFTDSFGNRCARFLAPAGNLRLSNSTVIDNSREVEIQNWSARQLPVHELPTYTLQYLLNSRYCEVDHLSIIATELFGGIEGGWARVQAVCDWVKQKVTFGYNFARPTKTALDVYTERTGVCRDFQHLAVTFCRCLNIPARYATGYLNDFRIPDEQQPPPDFSAWFQVYLEDQWWNFDARHNLPGIDRVLMAVGRDASDVAITTSFGQTTLKNFQVLTTEAR
jgi:transglutaminase-like putative cysteine protease